MVDGERVGFVWGYWTVSLRGNQLPVRMYFVLHQVVSCLTLYDCNELEGGCMIDFLSSECHDSRLM